jgi:hypothetical protein
MLLFKDYQEHRIQDLAEVVLDVDQQLHLLQELAGLEAMESLKFNSLMLLQAKESQGEHPLVELQHQDVLIPIRLMRPVVL